MYDGQTIYRNRTLTHKLQQQAQETNPLSTVTISRSQPTVGQTGRKSVASSTN